MKKTYLGMLAAVIVAASGAGACAEPLLGEVKEAHLGVSVEGVPPAFYSQVPALLEKGQGVLVLAVEKDSPAAAAGLLPHDIVLMYGDQKIYSSEQFVKLVRSARPGHEVVLTYLRGGKLMTGKAILAEYKPATVREKMRVFRLLPDEPLRKMVEDAEAKSEDASWEGFVSMKLTRLPEHRWREEVEFQTKDGAKTSREYTGTREEIRAAIIADKELSTHNKNHLLRAMNFHIPVFEFHFPANMPSLTESGNHP